LVVEREVGRRLVQAELGERSGCAVDLSVDLGGDDGGERVLDGPRSPRAPPAQAICQRSPSRLSVTVSDDRSDADLVDVGRLDLPHPVFAACRLLALGAMRRRTRSRRRPSPRGITARIAVVCHRISVDGAIA